MILTLRELVQLKESESAIDVVGKGKTSDQKFVHLVDSNFSLRDL